MKLPEHAVLYGGYAIGGLAALLLGGFSALVGFAAGAGVAYAIHQYEAHYGK